MTLLYADRVLETSTTTGTGALTLAGAVTGYQTFVDGIGDGNTCYYCVTDGTDWEVGRGTVTYGSSDTLSRDTVLSSSNNGNVVSWAAGTRNVFCTIPASRIQLVDPDADPYDWWMDSDATDAAISGGAAQFTAPDKCHLTITDAAQTNLDAGTADFSVSVCFKPAAVSGTQGIVSKGGDDASSPGYEIWLDGTTCKGSMTADGVQYVATIGTVAASTWYLAVLTADRNGNLTGYLNGAAGTPVDISSDDGQTASNSDDFYIGSRQGASWFGGDMCCVGFWDALLTSGNVTTLWNNGNPLYHADLPAALTTDLISFWDMNEQVIDSTHDCIDKVSATGNDLGFVAAELVTNGAFAADTDWAKGTGWSIGSGVAACDGSAGTNTYLTQSGVLATGNSYATSYDVVSRTQGGTRIYVGSGSPSTTKTTTGTFTQTLTCSGNTDVLMSSRDSGGYFGGTIDNVSVKSSRLNTSNGPATAIASDVIGDNHAQLMGRTAATSISDWRTDLPTPLQGKRVYSLNHDGSDDRELYGIGAFRGLVLGAAGVTISVWVKLSSLKGTAATDNCLCGVLSAGGNVAILLHVRSDAGHVGELNAYARSSDADANQIKSSTAVIAAGAWNHVALVINYASDTVEFFVNGAADGAQSVTFAETTYQMTSHDLSDQFPYYNGAGADVKPIGLFSDVRIYSAALSPAQIAELHAGNEASGATPVAHWTFDDGPQGSPGQDSPIINWISSDGSRYQFVQSTLSKCPSYDLSVLNSLPGIYFDGVDDYLTSSTTTVLNSTEDTITIVGKLGASAFDADQVLLACSDTATANYYWEVGIDSAGKFYIENKENDTADRVTGNTVMSPSDDFVLTITSDGFDYYMFVNRVAQTLTVTSGANSGEMPKDISGIDNMTIGGKVDSTGLVRPFEGWIIEILEEADWHGADDVNSIQSPTMKAYTIT